MELRIKTYDEVSSERVTIEVSPGQKVEIQMIDGAPSADDHAPDGPWDRLQKRAEEVDRLKRELAEVMSQRNQYQRERNDRTTEVRRLEARIQGLGVRHQRELADLRAKITEETKKAEAFKAQVYGENDKAAALRTQLAESRKLVADRSIRNQQALRMLSTEQVEKDMDLAGTELSARLKEAIRAAREELGDTSQA